MCSSHLVRIYVYFNATRLLRLLPAFDGKMRRRSKKKGEKAGTDLVSLVHPFVQILRFSIPLWAYVTSGAGPYKLIIVPYIMTCINHNNISKSIILFYY